MTISRKSIKLRRKDVAKISIAGIVVIALLILAPCVGIAAIIYGIVGLKKLLNETIEGDGDKAVSDIDH